MANENPDFSELNDEIRKLRENFATLGQSVSSTNQSMVQAAGNTSKAAQDAANATNNSTAADKKYKDSKEELIKKMMQFGSAVHNSAMSTENNMSKYSNALSSAGDAVGAFVGQFGLLGKAAEYAIKAFTMAADAVMKQNDAIFKSYDGLGKFGATVGMTTNDVLNLGIKAGYSSKNLESLYKPAKELGMQLVALGGSSSGGIKAFAEIASIGETARQNFRALGFSQAEVTEMQADYVKEVTKAGGAIAKTPRELSKESQNYIGQLTLLAEITGKSVKEQQKARSEALLQQNVNAFIYDLEQKKARALQSNDKVEADRLQKQIDGTKVFVGHVKATEGAEVALAKMQSVATHGAVVYDENNSILLQMGYSQDRINEALRRGEDPLKVLAMNSEMNAKAYERAQGTFGDNLFAMGKASIGFQNLTGTSNELREVLARDAKANQKLNAMSKEEREKFDKLTIEEKLKLLQEDKKQSDERIKLDNAMQEAEREYRKAMEELTSMLSKFVLPVLTTLFKLFGAISTALMLTIENFSQLADHFDDFMEFLQELGMKFRDSAMGKFLGAKGVTAEEKKAFEEQKAARQKEIKDRQQRRFATEPPKEEAKPAAPGAAPAKPAPAAPAPAPGAPAPAPGAPAPAPGAPAAPSKPPAPPSAPSKPPEAKQDVKENLASITESLKKRGITDQNYINAVIGNVMKESQGKVVNENLNYGGTKNTRIREIFGERASKYTDAELDQIKKDPQQMAEMMYGGGNKIGKQMGNTEPGDGWKFRGRGYIQLTGKKNYAAASKDLFGDDRLVKDPDLVNDPKIASEVTAWYMQQGQKDMAGRLGIDLKGPIGKEQAALLTTSQIAGVAVKKGSGYLGNEVLDKVAKYSDQYGNNEPPKLQEGGIVNAPKTGMLAELHGNELVAPLDPNSLVAKLLVAPFSEIQKEMQKSMDIAKTEPVTPAAGSTEETMTAMIDMLAEKLDTVIDKLSDGNDTQDKLLTYSMV